MEQNIINKERKDTVQGIQKKLKCSVMRSALFVFIPLVMAIVIMLKTQFSVGSFTGFVVGYCCVYRAELINKHRWLKPSLILLFIVTFTTPLPCICC